MNARCRLLLVLALVVGVNACFPSTRPILSGGAVVLESSLPSESGGGQSGGGSGEAFGIDPVLFGYSATVVRPSGAVLRHVGLSSLPLVHLRVVLPTGFLDDGMFSGVSSLTAWSMLDGATGVESTVTRALGVVRAYGLRVRVTASETVFSVSVLASDLNDVVAHMGQMLAQPAFRPSALHRARAHLLTQYRPAQLAQNAAMFGIPVQTESEWRQALYRLDTWHCRNFYTTHYTPVGATVVMVGGVDVESAGRITDNLFSGLKVSRSSAGTTQAVSTALSAQRTSGSTMLTTPTVVKGGTATRVQYGETERMEWTEQGQVASRSRSVLPGDLASTSPVDIVFVAPGPARDDADWPALWLVAKVLGSECSPFPWAAEPSAFRVCKRSNAGDYENWLVQTRERLKSIAVNGLDVSVAVAVEREIVEAEAVRLSDPEALADALVGWDPSLISGFGSRLGAVGRADTADAVSRLLQMGSLREIVAERKELP